MALWLLLWDGGRAGVRDETGGQNMISSGSEWWARYGSAASDLPVVVWQEDDDGRVVGLVADQTGGPWLMRADSIDPFMGYVHKDRQ